MIYLVEDDASIRDFVLYTLNGQGLPATGFDRPSAFWEAMAQETPRLVLLDLMLPEEDGLQILKRLRASAKTEKLPILLLTAKQTEYDKVMGLDAGADDYVAKPFSMLELLSRIRALLRRTEPVDDLCRIGGLTLSPTRHVVQADGVDVALTQKEFQLLCLLAEHRGTVFSRSQLLDKIWDYGFDGETRTVDVHVRTLRQKLGACGDCIETVRGFGYKIGEDA
ncbi:MAG: response regulator transcription factor [Oscillospiraceae bacterium]